VSELTSFGVLGFWVQADAVGRSAAALLALMSVATWYLIVTKTLQLWRTRREAERALEAFWQAPELDQAVERMRAAAAASPFYDVAAQGAAARAHHDRHVHGSLAEALDVSEFVTRALRRAVQRATAGLDSGLAVLASVGATAPFVGLFGTVWGIYHALIGIGFTGQATIDKVAGPVGEALIMTAFGIAVAVPAVLAYNFLLRAYRVIAAELDGFAHDLHAYLTTGARLGLAGRSQDGPATAASERRRA
jgi:biopolymer transport protein ExbB